MGLGTLPPVNSIQMANKDIWDAMTIVYPICKQGLEIECDLGYNIAVGHKRGQNLWGISSADKSEGWRKNGVSSFCKTMKPTEIDYKQNSFDMVINNHDLSLEKKPDARKMLKHVKRICNGIAYLKLPITDKLTFSWWLHTILKVGFIVEIFHEATNKQIVVELKC